MRKPLLLLLALISAHISLAQSTEVGVNLFTSHYFGSLSQGISSRGFGDYFSYKFSSMDFGGGLHLRYSLKDHHTALRFDLNYARISGADSLSKNDAFASRRNLSFRNDIIEAACLVEYHFREFGWGLDQKTFSPYALIGLSFFRHNPQAKYNNEWVDLQPLKTEGQDLFQYRDKSSYSLFQIGIPIGLGLKFAVSEDIRFGFEAGYRITFTNYLDDVGGTYADKDVLIKNVGPTAAALADRSKEANGGSLPGFSAGDVRDGSSFTDGFAFLGVNLSFIIHQRKCPRF
jgi:hypothetical protein